jgi:protein SCO1/2
MRQMSKRGRLVFLFVMVVCACVFVLLTAAQVAAQKPSHVHDAPAAPPPARYTRTVARYEPPDVTLVAMDGTKTALAHALNHDGPVMLQFIFTTCPTICPVMSSTLSAAQEKLGDDLGKVSMVSISIDPEHDTPERLRDYARKFRAGRQWLFLTGSTEDIEAVQKAFDAYRGNKMRHEPLTFLRAAPEEPWVRLDGLMSATQLVAEYKLLTAR